MRLEIQRIHSGKRVAEVAEIYGIPRGLRVAEVAEIYVVSVPTIWRWTRAGKIPAPQKICGSTRWGADKILAHRAAQDAA